MQHRAAFHLGLTPLGVSGIHWDNCRYSTENVLAENQHIWSFNALPVAIQSNNSFNLSVL